MKRKREQNRLVVFAGIGVVILALLTLSCINKRNLTGLSIRGYNFRGNALGNLRWEMDTNPIVHPSENLRMREGEKFVVRWDKFYGFWEKDGQMCNFADVNVSTENCRVCQDCNPVGEEHNITPCGFVVYNKEDIGSFEVFEYPGFNTMPENRRVAYRAASSAWVCSQEVTVAPTTDATYQLPDDVKVHGETKVHVYSGAAKSVAYPLRRQTIDNRTYWTWTIEGIGKWLENYSPALKIANVRIYEAACAVDEKSGDCLAPSAAPRLKPSRILFLPNFAGSVDATNEASFRCYSTDREDERTKSFIDMQKCLIEYQSMDAGQARVATPTYMHGSEHDRLTWLVEFNTNEGGSVVPNNAQLIIEFDIIGV